jgi:hypothetical protein
MQAGTPLCVKALAATIAFDSASDTSAVPVLSTSVPAGAKSRTLTRWAADTALKDTVDVTVHTIVPNIFKRRMRELEGALKECIQKGFLRV